MRREQRTFLIGDTVEGKGFAANLVVDYGLNSSLAIEVTASKGVQGDGLHV